RSGSAPQAASRDSPLLLRIPALHALAAPAILADFSRSGSFRPSYWRSSEHRQGAGPNGDNSMSGIQMHATTIVAVRHDGRVALGGDGQVTMGETVMKADRKSTRLNSSHVKISD